MAGEQTNNANDDLVSVEGHQRVTSAIRAAERGTSGEIFAVVAQESDDYFYISSFFAAFWSLCLLPLATLLLHFLEISFPLYWLVTAQFTAFLCLLLLLRFYPALRMMCVPRSIAYRRASNNAVRQFLAHGVHATDTRSGVLLFVSLAERYAEVVADAAINELVDQAEWDAMVSSLIDGAKQGDLVSGFEVAIERAGALLSEHFPPSANPNNELDDRLVEL